MKDKLRLIMETEGLKPSQLANILGIKPSNVTHLLKGRNKPNCDSLQNIFRRFPRISPDWLLLDVGPMYRDEASTDSAAPSSGASSSDTGTANAISAAAHGPNAAAAEFPFDGSLFGALTDAAPASAGEPAGQPYGRPTVPAVGSAGQPAAQPAEHDVRTAATIERIVVFYTDHSFDTYTPKR